MGADVAKGRWKSGLKGGQRRSTFTNTCLDGSRALVTGASSGIGAAVARTLSAAGALVALSGRNQERLHLVAADLPQPLIIPADLQEAGAAGELASRIQQTWGGVDILVNCAGIGEGRLAKEIAGQRTAPSTESVLDSVWAVNVRAPLVLIGMLVPAMQSAQHGSIINISSATGLIGTPYQAGYAASNGAIDAMTRSLASEYGSSGVRVNSIAPGFVKTEMWGSALENQDLVEGMSSGVSLRRWAEPVEIADAVLFLASDASRYITGETFLVDGGLVRTLNGGQLLWRVT